MFSAKYSYNRFYIMELNSLQILSFRFYLNYNKKGKFVNRVLVIKIIIIIIIITIYGKVKEDISIVCLQSMQFFIAFDFISQKV